MSGVAEERLAALLGLLANGREDALLRYSLGAEYLALGQPGKATTELERALELDPRYSAAWKLLGRAQTEDGQAAAARETYRRGIEVARARGDEQAAKEMTVFLRRIERGRPSGG